MVRTMGRVASGIFSRWMLFAALIAVVGWNIHVRIDQLSSPMLHGARISAATTDPSLSQP